MLFHFQFSVPRAGNAVIYSACADIDMSPRCTLIIKYLPGYFPLAKAVTKVMANIPQSKKPFCI